MFCISLSLCKKRELFTLNKFSLSLRANDISFFNKLSKAALYIISLLFKNKTFKLVISYRIIKPVISLLTTLSATSYFCDKDVTNFLKT